MVFVKAAYSCVVAATYLDTHVALHTWLNEPTYHKVERPEDSKDYGREEQSRGESAALPLLAVEELVHGGGPVASE